MDFRTIATPTPAKWADFRPWQASGRATVSAMIQMRHRRSGGVRRPAAEADQAASRPNKGRCLLIRPYGSPLQPGWTREVITAVDDGHDKLMLASELRDDEWAPAWEVHVNPAEVEGIVRAPYGVGADLEERLRDTGWQPALVDCPPGAPAHHQWFVLTAEAARRERSRRLHPSAERHEAAAVGSPAGGLGLDL